MLMKRAQSTGPSRTNRSNDHVIRVAVATLALPATLARWVRAAVVRVIRSMTTGKDLRAADQLRQSRARRELRGLPADHDPAAARRPA
jgi:hypothetical protein